MMNYTRDWTLRKEKRHCTDWRDRDTKQGGRSRRHTSGGMGMSRRECTEVTDETVQQQNDGK